MKPFDKNGLKYSQVNMDTMQCSHVPLKVFENSFSKILCECVTLKSPSFEWERTFRFTTHYLEILYLDNRNLKGPLWSLR